MRRAAGTTEHIAPESPPTVELDNPVLQELPSEAEDNEFPASIFGEERTTIWKSPGKLQKERKERGMSAHVSR